MTAIVSVFFKHKRGGFNKRLYELYLGLAKRGVQVHYVAAEPFPLSHENIHAHVLCVPFSARENYLFWTCFLLMAPFHILHITLKYAIDRFVVFEPPYACLCLIAKLVSRKHLITFIRSDVEREYRLSGKPFLQIIFNRMTEFVGLRLSDRVIPNSRVLADTLTKRYGLDRDRFAVLPNNIRNQTRLDQSERQLERIRHGMKGSDYVVATMGAFNATKNLAFLIKSFSEASVAASRLLIIGDAVGKDKDERRNLEELVRDLGLERQTVFAGWLEEPVRLLSTADLFVIPSKEEGSPNALLEALGCGLPCLGSRIPEINEVLRHDELLFSLSSSTELADKIKRAAESDAYHELLCRLSAVERERFLFNWEDRVWEYIDASARASQRAHDRILQ